MLYQLSIGDSDATVPACGSNTLAVTAREAARYVARTDAASANFFRAAGNVFDITTDAVIYDRERDGSFCTVTNVAEIARPLVSEADAVAEALATASEPSAR